MATRSRIAIETQSGSFLSAYHYWDGYPTGLGANLVKNWTDYDKVYEAIELGDASTWGSDKESNFYYGRDRNESDTEPMTSENIMDLLERGFKAHEDYLYILSTDGEWRYYWYHDLEACLSLNDELTEAVE